MWNIEPFSISYQFRLIAKILNHVRDTSYFLKKKFNCIFLSRLGKLFKKVIC